MSVDARFQKKTMYTQLSKQEVDNPYLVIEELFDFAHLPDVREMLWDWLKTTVTGSFHKTLSSADRHVMIALYEKMEKLTEAAHILLELHYLKQQPIKKRGAYQGRKAKKK